MKEIKTKPSLLHLLELRKDQPSAKPEIGGDQSLLRLAAEWEKSDSLIPQPPKGRDEG